MLAVVASDVEVADEYQFERRQFGSNPAQLRELAEWLLEQGVVLRKNSVRRAFYECTSL